MAQGYEDWIAAREDADGIRFSWNNLPTSRVEAARMVRKDHYNSLSISFCTF
jgi:hypothetical protein